MAPPSAASPAPAAPPAPMAPTAPAAPAAPKAPAAPTTNGVSKYCLLTTFQGNRGKYGVHGVSNPFLLNPFFQLFYFPLFEAVKGRCWE